MPDNWLPWVQTITTVVLVGVTWRYVVLTGRMATQAEESAKSAAASVSATERSAETAERGLALQAMPLVFGHRVRPTAGGAMELDLFGFGQMPAFQVMVVVRQKDPAAAEGELNEGHAGPLDHHDPTRSSRSIDLSPRFRLVDFPQPYDVEITYQDALGTWYRTTRRSLLRGQSLLRVERKTESDEWEELVGGF